MEYHYMYFDMYGNEIFIEVSKKDFPVVISQFITECYKLAETYVGNHASGLADFNLRFCSDQKKRLNKQCNFYCKEIDDEALKGKMRNFIDIIDNLDDVDRRIIAIYKTAIKETGVNIEKKRDIKKLVYKFLYLEHRQHPTEVMEIARDAFTYLDELEKLKQSSLSLIEELSM